MLESDKEHSLPQWGPSLVPAWLLGARIQRHCFPYAVVLSCPDRYCVGAAMPVSLLANQDPGRSAGNA